MPPQIGRRNSACLNHPEESPAKHLSRGWLFACCVFEELPQRVHVERNYADPEDQYHDHDVGELIDGCGHNECQWNDPQQAQRKANEAMQGGEARADQQPRCQSPEEEVSQWTGIARERCRRDSLVSSCVDVVSESNCFAPPTMA